METLAQTTCVTTSAARHAMKDDARYHSDIMVHNQILDNRGANTMSDHSVVVAAELAVYDDIARAQVRDHDHNCDVEQARNCSNNMS